MARTLCPGMPRALPLAVGFALALACVRAAHGQSATGNIYGTVTDEAGGPLRGATVQLVGAGIAPRSTVTSDRGEFRFLALEPGAFRVAVKLDRFADAHHELTVSTGANVEVTFRLRLTTQPETTTVTAASPLDTKKVGNSTVITNEELHRVPNSRDAYSLLRTVPGVLVATVNIAGDDAGNQSSFIAGGAAPRDAQWSLDGVSMTDMVGPGASAAYYSFQAFDEVSVTTGGQDIRAATGGVSLNFATKRGTDRFRGAAYGYFAHDALQWSNLPAVLERDARLRLPDGTQASKADHIRQIAEYGVEAGGPLIRDKLWLWAAYGRQDIRIRGLNQIDDKTVLPMINAKLSWQATSRDTLSLLWFRPEKVRKGISVGGPLVIPDESFLGDQQADYPPGPPGLLKLEASRVFRPHLFLTARYAFYPGASFTRTPRGGRDRDGGIDFVAGRAYGSSDFYGSQRLQHTANLDVSWFRSAFGGSHEVKFGFAYRSVSVSSTASYSGSKVFAQRQTPTDAFALVTRDSNMRYGSQYASGYLGDTFVRGPLTLNLGLRLDHQTGGSRPSSSAANPVFPQLLPALRFDGAGQGATWTDVSPRAGITMALDKARKTVARLSYAVYAGQLGTFDAVYDSPLGGVSFLAYPWVDTNGDGLAQPGEVRVAEGLQYYGWVDPTDPANLTSPNRIDREYGANHDRELIVGLERELSSGIVARMAFTHRRSLDTQWTPRIGLDRTDYRPNLPVTRNGFTAQTFSPDPVKVASTGGGRILIRRPDFALAYNGVELSVTKRLAKRWMARLAAAYMDWVEDHEGPAFVQNPTRTPVECQEACDLSGPQVDGGQASAGGRFGRVNGKWQLAASGLYELPLGLELSAALLGRQGFPRPIVLRLAAGLDGALPALADPRIDTHRFPDVWNLDLRLAKTLRLSSSRLIVSADMFNAFNNGTVLGANRQANSPAFGQITEIVNPRIVRLGLRLTF